MAGLERMHGLISTQRNICWSILSAALHYFLFDDHFISNNCKDLKLTKSIKQVQDILQEVT